MKRFGYLTTILGFSAAAALAMQGAPPAPPTPAARPAAPAPAPLPAPAVAATPAVPPQAPGAVFLEDQDTWRDYSRQTDQVRQQMEEQARQQAEQARQQAEQDREQGRVMAEQARVQAEQAREEGRVLAEQAREQARRAVEDMRLNIDIPTPAINLNLDLSPQMRGPVQVATPAFGRRLGNDNSLYGRGQTALDDHKYDQALDYFSEVVARGGPKADGALYWKAYTLNKLGRRDDAQAAIAQLRTSFASSHWLDDAKALELEVKQESGKPVSPESESDDDLKLMALNGLAQTDPARAFPLLEKLLKGPASPKLKKNAIYVLAINTSPQAQQLLEQIARGNSNPDLQLTAISYMLRNKQFPNRTQTLFEIYGTTNDPAVKREIINALRSNGDTDHLAQIYKAEKDSDLRRSAISGLGERGNGSAELWQLYQNETTPEGKIMILDAMHDNGSTEKLADVARNDKDPKVRIRAIQVLSSYRAANLGDTLQGLYTAEQDQQVKREIIRELSSQRNAKGLVDLFHKESNFDMKKAILADLERMHTPEANELYMEILGK